MSQTQIKLLEVRQWLSKDAESLIEPLQAKARSLIKEIKERVDDATDSSQKILHNSQSEMDKGNPKTHRFARNANKFAEGLINTLGALKVSDSTQHESIRVLCDDLEKTCANIDQLRRSAYPYISPYFIFDRRRLDVFIKRLYDISKEMRGFLTSKYAAVKTVDDAYSHVDKLVQTLDQTRQNDQNLRQTEERMLALEKAITETKDKLLLVRSKGEFHELNKLDQRVDQLRTEVKHSLRYLQKPFYKLQSLSRSGEVAVPPDELRKLEEYLQDPLTALAAEDNGYPTLKSILKKLETTMAQGKLKLKATRLRKAQDQTDAVLNKNTLDQLQRNGREALTQRRQLMSSEATRALQSELTQLQEQLETLQKDYELTAARNKALKSDQTKLRERTEHLRKELEGQVLQVTRKNVQIVLTS
jgi:DNA repair exonuclease SbcCD ATPase subunit